jgi:hypothetical protein
MVEYAKIVLGLLPKHLAGTPASLLCCTPRSSRMPKYTTGARVSQGQYGPGTILESNQHHTVIDFDEHGARRFITTMVELQSSKVPAPVKKKRAKARKKTS